MSSRARVEIALATSPISPRIPLLITGVGLVVVILVSTSIGPADLSISTVAGVLLSHVPLIHYHSSASTINQAIVWDIRLPQVVLGGIVGAMLAAGGASYQGVFRNPLADPYLLGVAAGAGLGATIVIVTSSGSTSWLPVAAFIGGAVAVTLTYFVGAKFGGRSSGTSVVLAGRRGRGAVHRSPDAACNNSTPRTFRPSTPGSSAA